MFRGNHPARVDEKGRLKLPADFKSELEGGGEGKQVFYITSKDGKRAEIWPLKAWEEVEANLKKIPNMNPRGRGFTKDFIGFTTEGLEKVVRGINMTKKGNE